MEKKKISYAEAIAEVEEILSKMNGPGLDVDQLASYVERATELLGLCKEKLLKAQQQVEKVLDSTGKSAK